MNIRVLHIGKFGRDHPGGMESMIFSLVDGLRDRVESTVVTFDRDTARQVNPKPPLRGNLKSQTSPPSPESTGPARLRLNRHGHGLRRVLRRLWRACGNLNEIPNHNAPRNPKSQIPNPNELQPQIPTKSDEKVINIPARVVRSAPVARLGSKVDFGEYDVIHIHLPNPVILLQVARRDIRAPIVATWHSDIIKQKLLRIPYRPLEKRFLKRIASVVTTSEAYAGYSRQLKGLTNIRTIHLGTKMDESVMPRAAVAGGRVLFVGRLVEYKGLEYLVEAMRSNEHELRIAGDGPLRGRLEREIGELEIGNRVSLLGVVSEEEKRNLYLDSDLFCLPSVTRSEAFGMVQAEAMSYGLPVINTRLETGVPEVSVDGLTGITVKPRDPKAINDAIVKLMSDQETYATYSANAIQRARELFSLERMCERYYELYREITVQT